MALSTASTWPWSREPFSTIFEGVFERNELLPFENAFNGVDCVHWQFGQVSKRALADVSTHPIGLTQQDGSLELRIGDDVDMHAHYNSINNVNNLRHSINYMPIYCPPKLAHDVP